MSSNIDPAKLKVVDLRNELSTRGLDTKGNKAALVKRLKDALEGELNKELPDTSIADTSTEDLDTSVTETPKKAKPGGAELEDQDEPPPSKTPEKPNAELEEKPKPADKSPEKVAQPPENVTKSPEKIAKSPEKEAKPLVENQPASSEPTMAAAQDGSAPKESEVTTSQHEDGENGDEAEKMETNEGEESTAAATDEAAAGDDPENKREKRKRDSDSPEREQKKRARSPRPIKEDEPAIDNDKVLLSWYDSDLNLQIDKESFLSAKPLTDAAFGYVWAGARANYGVHTGKVCFEVKITEEIKWEDDFSQHRNNRRENAKKAEEKKKREENAAKDKAETEKTADKMETEEGKSEAAPEKVEENSETAPEKSEENNETAPEKSEEASEAVPSSEAVPEKAEENSEAAPEKPLEEEEEKKENDAVVAEEPKPAETESKEVEAAVEEKKEPLPTHFFRVGWSVGKSSLQLGEDQFSFAYESTGKFVNSGDFNDYGVGFGNGDVIGAYLEIDSTDVVLTYTVNGEKQPGEACRFAKADLPEDFVLFPHILTRNYSFEVNWGDREEPWCPPADDDFVFVGKAEERVAGPVRPDERKDCEVLLMCGLPASGKTHWVKEHISSNADKDYTILGKVSLLERMTICGEPLQSRFQGKWQVFLDKMQKSLNKLVWMAALRRRNYIIDQTNVFPSAQRRKLRPFEGFKRRAIIVVVADEEQARRQSLQEAQEGKGVPESTILEMKAAMILPEKGDWLEEVSYVGAEEAEAKEIVKKYNTSGREAGYSSEKRFGYDRRHDSRGRGGFRGNWNNQYQRYDSRGKFRPYGGGGGGGWNRDRYDNRDYRGGGRSYGGDRDGYQDNYRYRSHPYAQQRGGGGGSRGWGGGGGWGGRGGGWGQQGGQGWGAGGGNSQWKNSGGGQGYGGGGGGYWNNYSQYGGQNWGQR